MKNIKYLSAAFLLFALIMGNSGCSSSSGNNPGHEYMPDMAHSIAYEANHLQYYRPNTWESEENLRDFYVKPMLPVKGTIPRGYTGMSLAKDPSDAMEKSDFMAGTPMNGHVPYYYDDTEEERTRAMAEITENPYPITQKGLDKGKDLYEIYCGICHGDKGEGDGYIVRDDGGKYPAQPANLVSDEFIGASEGRFYHAVMHGKNVMGGYADKLSYEERWEVIHYIRSLQAKKTGTAYDPIPDPDAAFKSKFSDLLSATSHGGGHESGHGDAHGGDHGEVSGAVNPNVMRLENVFFATGSSQLKAVSRRELNVFAEVLADSGTNVEISGHTDNVGDAASNMSLSQDRAVAVRNYLISRGINASQITAKGYGDSRPVASNSTDEGRQQNRRTEFEILRH